MKINAKRGLKLERTTIRNLTDGDLRVAAGGTSGQGSQTYRANGRIILGAVQMSGGIAE